MKIFFIVNWPYLLCLAISIFAICGIWFGNYIIRYLINIFTHIFDLFCSCLDKKKKKYYELSRQSEYSYSIICYCLTFEERKEKGYEWYNILQNELDRLPLGQILFNPPERMKQGKKERIVLRMSKDLNLDIKINLKSNSIANVEKIIISELTKVNLSGDGFEIHLLNETEQIIGTKEYTEWAWDLYPQKTGQLILRLKITLRIIAPFGIASKDHPIIEKEIEVQRNPIYSINNFAIKHWKWIITALIIPIIGWSLKMIFKY